MSCVLCPWTVHPVGTSQHGPNYLKVFLNLVFPSVTNLPCRNTEDQCTQVGKTSKVLLRCFHKGSLFSSLEWSRKRICWTCYFYPFHRGRWREPINSHWPPCPLNTSTPNPQLSLYPTHHILQNVLCPSPLEWISKFSKRTGLFWHNWPLHSSTALSKSQQHS